MADLGRGHPSPLPSREHFFQVKHNPTSPGRKNVVVILKATSPTSVSSADIQNEFFEKGKGTSPAGSSIRWEVIPGTHISNEEIGKSRKKVEQSCDENFDVESSVPVKHPEEAFRACYATSAAWKKKKLLPLASPPPPSPNRKSDLTVSPDCRMVPPRKFFQNPDWLSTFSISQRSNFEMNNGLYVYPQQFVLQDDFASRNVNTFNFHIFVHLHPVDLERALTEDNTTSVSISTAESNQVRVQVKNTDGSWTLTKKIDFSQKENVRLVKVSVTPHKRLFSPIHILFEWKGEQQKVSVVDGTLVVQEGCPSYRECFSSQIQAGQDLWTKVSRKINDIETERGSSFKKFDVYWMSPNSLTLSDQSLERLSSPNGAFLSYYLKNSEDLGDFRRLFEEIQKRVHRFGGKRYGKSGGAATFTDMIDCLKRGDEPATSLGTVLRRIFLTKRTDAEDSVLNVVIFDECHRQPGQSSIATQFIRFLTSDKIAREDDISELQNVIFIGISATCENQLQV